MEADNLKIDSTNFQQESVRAYGADSLVLGDPVGEASTSEEYSEKWEQWCSRVVQVCYITVAINAVVLITIWAIFSAGEKTVAQVPYWINIIILPTAGMFVINAAVDLVVRSKRIPLAAKKYASLLLMFFLCVFVCIVHDNTAALLVSFVAPVFVSTIFANLKMTRHIFQISLAAQVLCAVKMTFYSDRPFGDWILMELLAAIGLLAASYLLAKILIRFSEHNITTLRDSFHRQISLKEQLTRDSLTGLLNRKAYDERLPLLMQQCRQANTCLSLAVLDLDHFKQVNDMFGHAAGDKVLLRLANILLRNKTENIDVFRIGGEEFVLLLKNYCVNDAYKICEGVRSIMESSSVPEVRNKRVTFSCGLACMNKTHETPVSLFQAADSALYKAKESGRNKTLIYDGPSLCIKEESD